MDDPLTLLTAAREAAARLGGQAALVHDLAEQARRGLDSATYECDAGARDRARAAEVAGRCHAYGNALASAAEALLRGAAALAVAP